MDLPRPLTILSACLALGKHIYILTSWGLLCFRISVVGLELGQNKKYLIIVISDDLKIVRNTYITFEAFQKRSIYLQLKLVPYVL